MLTLGNVAWWKVQMPDRTEDGELVLVPVRLKFRLYTRQELRDRKARKVQDGVAQMRAALDASATSTSPEELREAAQRLHEASVAMLAGEAEDDGELSTRILDWRADDISGEPFSADLLAALLSDEARFRACRDALDDASNGAPTKN